MSRHTCLNYRCNKCPSIGRQTSAFEKLGFTVVFFIGKGYYKKIGNTKKILELNSFNSSDNTNTCFFFFSSKGLFLSKKQTQTI